MVKYSCEIFCIAMFLVWGNHVGLELVGIGEESTSENGKGNKLSFKYISQYFYVDRGGKGEGNQLDEVGGRRGEEC